MTLFQLRKKRKLTQEALAHIAKITLRTYQSIEYGHTMPRLDTAKRIADSLFITLDELYEALTR